MRIIVLNKQIRDKIRGPFSRHKGKVYERFNPLRIAPDTYILNFENIKRLRYKLKHSKYADIIKDNISKFTIGDGSPSDLIYQQYLKDIKD